MVLGLPLGPDGEVGPAAKSAQAFAERLRAALPVPVELIDESFTTVEARRSCSRPTTRARTGDKRSIAWRPRLS